MPNKIRYWGKEVQQRTTVGRILSYYPFSEKVYQKIARNLLNEGGYKSLRKAIVVDLPLNKMFLWKDTAEGHTYWWALHNIYLLHTHRITDVNKEVQEAIQ